MKRAEILFSVIIAYFNIALSQEEVAFRQRNIVLDELPAPNGLFALFGPRSPTFFTLGWIPLKNVSTYTLRIYRGQDGPLVHTLTGLVVTFKNVTGLQSSTSYRATVSAVYKNPEAQGLNLETRESEPVSFTTDAECIGGQFYSDCYGHCTPTCGDPDPICSRVCTPGCACPLGLPIWHDQQCIPRVLCPTMTGEPVRPKNVRLVKGGSNQNVVVTWNPVSNVSEYTVMVRSARSSQTASRSYTSVVPIIAIPDLTPGEQYEIAVAASLQAESNTAPSDGIPPPTDISAIDLTNSSFRVRWTAHPDAARHVFHLYDESRSTLLYSNDKIAGSAIDMDGLAPGTTYYYTVASARREERFGNFSSMRGVLTQGDRGDLQSFHASVIVGVPLTTTIATTTTTRPNTRCLQRYESVRNFYETFPEIRFGPEYPNCDAQGSFVTRSCLQNSEDKCWCIRPNSGLKIRGTDFGGSNSVHQLNCDQLGTLNDQVEDLRTDVVKSSSVSLEWTRMNRVHGFVVTLNGINGVERTMSVRGDSSTYTITNLRPGRRYTVGVFVVDSDGLSGPTNTVEVTTLFVDSPLNVRVASKTGSSVTVEWDYDANADGYEVHLLASAAEEPIRILSDVTSNSVTFNNLNSSIPYTVSVRALTSQYFFTTGAQSDFVIHESEPTTVDFSLQCTVPPIDLLFVLDSSSSVGSTTNMQHVKMMVRSVTSAAPPVQPTNGTRVSVAQFYSGRTFARFGFTQLTSTSIVLEAAQRLITYIAGPPANITKALTYVGKRFFSPTASPVYRKRQNAESVVIVFSAGPSDDMERTRRAAMTLKSMATVIAVGVEGVSSDQVLTNIASRPDLKILSPSFDDLSSIASLVADKFCSF